MLKYSIARICLLSLTLRTEISSSVSSLGGPVENRNYMVLPDNTKHLPAHRPPSRIASLIATNFTDLKNVESEVRSKSFGGRSGVIARTASST